VCCRHYDTRFHDLRYRVTKQAVNHELMYSYRTFAKTLMNVGSDRPSNTLIGGGECPGEELRGELSERIRLMQKDVVRILVV